MDGLASTEAWQAVRHWCEIAKGTLRSCAIQLKSSRNAARSSVQPR
jgi:hypothetical protein